MEPIIYLFLAFIAVNLAVGLYYSRDTILIKACDRQAQPRDVEGDASAQTAG